METLEPYYRRFWKRFVKDATPWARDNIVWSALVVIIPPLAEYFHNPHAIIDWDLFKDALILYGFALLIYLLARLPFTAKHLDDERENREQTLITAISEHQSAIKQRDSEVRALREKPKRSAPDQYHYDRAKAFLDKQGARRAKFVAALQQLYTHGDLTYSVMGITMNTTWPKGMDRNEAIPIYDACVTEGLAKAQEIPGVHPARKISIAPATANVLSELLY